MEFFLSSPKKLNFLIVRDVDIASSAALAEKFIPNDPQFDAIIVCGPLLSKEASTPTEIGLAHGEIASIIGHLENIVCRVVYLPADSDPLVVLREHVNFTANSVNIAGRTLELSNDLYIQGYTELSEKNVLNNSNTAYSETEGLEDVEILSSLSIDILNELITPKEHTMGIFTIQYNFAHTLNHVLFHMNSELEAAHVKVLIVSPGGKVGGEEATRLPKTFGNLSIVAPRSLKKGYYSVLGLEIDEMGEWKMVRNADEQFPLPPADL